ncbi:hypothetical protein FZEAL_8686 [Fusarium zealandicum]|uniref:Ecp2 effector protein-like domain-containing protein n=1 Tax=Fusarium zealandicum TaxID=1053134 RepID=A0A8H4UDC7_9HYPO|nr:hypothetical protein FZEAL_8686 [Fusarium zealandicum]
MRFLALAAALVGLAAAAPAPTASPTLSDDIVVVSTATPSATPSAVFWTPSAKSVKVCNESSYSASEAPKSVKRADFRDCASLLSAFGPHKGAFTIPAAASYGGGLVDALKSDSCTFAVGAVEGPLRLGDGDVDFIVHKALLDYSAGLEMAAQGLIDCPVEGGGPKEKAKLHWRVSNSTRNHH